MLYPLIALRGDTVCELLAAGIADKLMMCARRPYTTVATGIVSITSTRPPIRGNPSLLKSITCGDCGVRPLNQGLTVWRSDEATSVGCCAIKPRMWLSTTDSATWLSGAGRSATQVDALPSAIANTTEG